MNRFDIINRIGDKYRIGNTETGEFSYAQALKTVGKDIKDYQKATTGAQHKFLDIRFENDRLAVLVECKNKFSRWDKDKIQGQLQDYVRFEKAYSDKKIVAILAETDGDEVWVWYGQSVIIDDEHRIQEETVLEFLYPEAEFSTEHGVKGEEYDNVVFVIGKGWNQYQFETYAPMITGHAPIPKGKQASYERNRNLFYVCCSRPKKRLIFFVTVPIDSIFKSFLVELVGEQNIFTFSQYIERKID